MAITITRDRRKNTLIEEESQLSCSECGGKDIVRDNEKGELICGTCGLVLTDHRIDSGPEWRAFTSAEKDARARTGAPANFAIHDKGLSTMIDWRDHDIQGRRFSAKQRAQIYRLRKWQIRSRVHSSVDRNLAQAMTELDRLASQNSLSKGIKELAAMLYRKAIVKRLIRSRSIDALIAASIYAACRLRESPISLEEIAAHSRCSKKKIGANYRQLVMKLKLRMPIPGPEKYVTRYITELGLPAKVQRKTLEILAMAKKDRRLITGRDPRGLAAAAIYIASILTDYKITQRDIASISGVTEVTVRNRYKELVNKLNLSMAPSA